MVALTFTIPGTPRGLQRHRSTRDGGQYDPDTNKVNKATIQFFALAEMRRKGASMITGSVSLEFTAYVIRPKAHFNSKGLLKESAPRDPICTPDLDNIEKLICDALNKVVWRDDAQVTKVAKERVYGEPRVEVRIVERQQDRRAA